MFCAYGVMACRFRRAGGATIRTSSGIKRLSTSFPAPSTMRVRQKKIAADRVRILVLGRRRTVNATAPELERGRIHLGLHSDRPNAHGFKFSFHSKINVDRH